VKKWAVLGVAAAVVFYAGGKQHPGAPVAGHATAVQVAAGSENAFFRGMLADLEAPATPADMRSLEAWFLHEWPSWPPRAGNNPMDTTLPAPGSTAFNTFGPNLHVQNYPSATEGAQMTAQTLLGGYPLIVAALRSGRGLCGAPSLAAEFRTWSGGAYSGVC
jgi:hypothetical protein